MRIAKGAMRRLGPLLPENLVQDPNGELIYSQATSISD